MDPEEINDYISSLDMLENKVVIYGIYKILEKGAVPCTKNENGRFYKMKDITGEILDELVAYIKFSINNKNMLNQRQQLINEALSTTSASLHQEEQEKAQQHDTSAAGGGDEVKPESVQEQEQEYAQESIPTLVKKTKIANKTWQKMLKECRTDKKNNTVNKTQLEGSVSNRLIKEADQAEDAENVVAEESAAAAAQPAQPAPRKRAPPKKRVKI